MNVIVFFKVGQVSNYILRHIVSLNANGRIHGEKP